SFDVPSLTGWTLRPVFCQISISKPILESVGRIFRAIDSAKSVDSDLCNFKDFVREIVDQLPHGYQEIVHVFYYDDVKKYSEVRTDQELLAMFTKHVYSKKVRMTITYTEPRDVPIAECCHPEISARLDLPCTPSLAAPSLAAASQSTQPLSSQHCKPTTSQSTEHVSSQH